MRTTLAHRFRRWWAMHGVTFLFITVRIIKALIKYTYAVAYALGYFVWHLFKGMFSPTRK